jgi:hypothetical protein
MSAPYSIFFLSYEEEAAEENWRRLRQIAPRAQRVHGVKGILNAHRTCDERAETDFFFVVDGDNEVLGFDFSASAEDPRAVHVWRCRNAVNDLVYGYGAVKLYPRGLLGAASAANDVATSVSHAYRIMPEVASVTRFNTSAWSAWRSGFRECVKLASRSIARQNSSETEERLEVWCSRGGERPFGEWCLAGARAGREYGHLHRQDRGALALINDYDWLKREFAGREAVHG